MDTLITRHPIALWILVIAITVMFATFYVLLSEDMLSAFPSFAGVPCSRVFYASMPSVPYLQACCGERMARQCLDAVNA